MYICGLFTHNFFLNTLNSMFIIRSFISGWTFPTEQINLTRNLPRTIKVTNSGKLWPCWQLKRNQAGSSEHARASRIARLFVDYYVPSAKSFLFSHQPFHFWDCILLVLPNKAVNFLFAQNLRHWVPLWFIDNTSDSGVLYRFVQRLINLPNGYEGNEKKVLFWSFSIRTSIFLGNILLVLLDWNCQNEYHHDQVTLHLSAEGCNKF